ncbi:murein hydrolase activator NlpD, partial [Salmonella enterica subsp. enterica serovar 1,4,[5],12:i:-]|nr:murein hydrolase activator NlpD [Salmonella enterica subsp. enterica serovar 1,4,[5],12:i:-]
VPAYGPQNDVTLKMPAFEWVHVQLHQQKGMISLSPPTICNSAVVTAPVTAPTVSTTEPNASSTSTSAPISAWRWPTDGKVIENFGASEGGNKGIDIAGSKGQAIVATADGRVVYAGNALRGYGNLIIIKHNDDYLSAYAHNDTMLVREQQEVKAGQKIATMGSTGTSSTRLHFEIRYKGKSVNPLRYLPQR